MKKGTITFIIVIVLAISVKILVEVLSNTSDTSQDKKETTQVLEQKKEEIAVKTYSQDTATQKIVEWLSNPSIDEGGTYLAPLILAPYMYKSVDNIEVKEKVLYITINVDKGYEYLRGEYSSGLSVCDNFAWELMQYTCVNFRILTEHPMFGYGFKNSLFDDFPNIKSIVIEIVKFKVNHRLDNYGNKLPEELQRQIIMSLKLNRKRAEKQNWFNILTEAQEKYRPIPSLKLGDPYKEPDWKGSVKYLQNYFDDSYVNWILIERLCEEF